ncbi:MAG TPA: reverse transcriptase domain-containing protein [Pirellulaceae bacterium]|nr:reverse transcriptase domain-containing protein [Pirellulaceae bacterium]
MASSTVQFISQVKLGELRHQRTLLVETYQRLEQECAAQPAVEALMTLYHGLRAIKVAGKPLHPDLENLELLLDGTAPSPEIVAFWRKRLESEVAAGRLRADIVYLFGALLGEWGNSNASRQPFLELRERTQELLLKQAVTSSEDAGRQATLLLSEIFAGLGDRLKSAPEKIAETMSKWIESGTFVGSQSAVIARDIDQPAAIRKEAQRIKENEVLDQEFRDALGIVTRDPRDWNWPAEGVKARTLWTRNKWRLFPELSLVDLSIVNRFGDFWSGAIQSAYSDATRKINRLSRYHKLLDLKAPEVIIENERRMLRSERERIDLGWYEPVDPWDGTPPLLDDGPVAGIVSRRAHAQAELREWTGGGYYGAYGANRLVSLVHAEVQTLRAAFPDRPFFIANLDIRDYFASIPHHVLLRMLQELGMPEVGVAAVRRFLEVPYLVGGQVTRARRGVPMGQSLSHWLAEWLLRLMERFLHQRAKVRIIRQIDDICLLAPTAEDVVAAWRAAHVFLESCGLAVNREKCGALAIGAEVPEELPSARPRWGLLELTAAGDWKVHEETFQTFLSDTRGHLLARHSLLARVTLYNAHLRFLTSSLGLALDLGDVHRDSINDALRRFEGELFGPGSDIVAGLRSSIAERYLEGTNLSHLPESWMYWPITAGGMGLRSAVVLGGQYQRAFEEQKQKRAPLPVGVPANSQTGDAAWAAYHEDKLRQLDPAKPKESKQMKTLVDDFIARGQEISGGKQQGLSDYWRWVLSIYGPEILDKFGTFRFLLTDLVPLQLIHEQLIGDNSFAE